MIFDSYRCEHPQNHKPASGFAVKNHYFTLSILLFYSLKVPIIVQLPNFITLHFITFNMNLGRLVSPKNYEHIEAVTRRHPITFVPRILLIAVLLLVPIALYWLGQKMFPDFISADMARTLIVLFASAYYLSVYLFFYSFFITFYLDMAIITNDRLIDVEQPALFSRTIAEVDLYQVQDVTSDVEGFFASVFDYGNVTLQTAGPIPKFILHNVPHPHQLREQILNLSAEDKKYHNS